MKKRIQYKFLSFILLAIISFALSGCEDATASNSAALSGVEVLFVGSSDTIYIDLDNEASTVSDSGSTDWDIGFTGGRRVLTNSGDSALSSGAEGGVFYTGTTDFDADLSTVLAEAKVILEDSSSDWDTYHHSDKYCWTTPSTSGMDPAEDPLNVMNYIGYGSGSGTESSPYTNYQYDADMFYTMPGTMGVYEVTNNVYIIRHGDGSRYSALQIQAMETDTRSNRTYAYEYKNLE